MDSESTSSISLFIEKQYVALSSGLSIKEKCFKYKDSKHKILLNLNNEVSESVKNCAYKVMQTYINM